MFDYSLGWHRDLPDHRDWFLDEHPEAARLFLNRPLFSNSDLPVASAFPLVSLASSVDLTAWCSPIENQSRLGSCTAQAAVGCVEYVEKRAKGRHIDGSRLFVYKTTRNLLGWTGDTGAYVRTTLKALNLFGAPPEKYWPYDISKFDNEPPPFVYAYGQNFRTIRYFRLDKPDQRAVDLLNLTRTVLAIALPVVFGFVVYNWGNQEGEFLMPGANDKPFGGHAILAVGYDDNRQIGDSKGALKIRNSWGAAWGERGYGWLPYDYVIQGLTSDYWTIFSQDYVLD